VLTFLLGPILALLPKWWRESLPASWSVEWRIATILSGFLESVVGLIGMMYWYSYSVTTWVSRGLDAALTGKTPQGTTEHEIGFVGLLIFATHPLTWFLAYCGVEGMVRLLGAAISENVLGIVPLYLIDRVIAKLTKRKREVPKVEGPGGSHLAATAEAIREKLLRARLPEVPDELCVTRNATDEFLEIRACRTKQDWVPPRVVRYLDTYYRLESSGKGTESRPYSYVLRRLPAGVPGRSVLLYKPEMEPIREGS
jgi:hypothetical protein